MYTVLLADDELAVIESLKSEIPWENLGVKTIYTAADGNQALELLHTYPVDLLITDIRMPHLDGLELLSILRKENSQIHCILLTAYDEFEYAKQAFSLGVENYLLKPMQTDELTLSVENALENLYANRMSRAELFRENILRRWILGTISSDELGEKTIYLDINIYQKEYCILAMKKTSLFISLHALTNTIFESISHILEYCTVWDNDGHFLILIGARKIPIDQIKTAINETVSHYKAKILPRIALGSIVSDRMQLHSSYEQACFLVDKSDIPIVPFKVLVPENNNPTALSILEKNQDKTPLSPVIIRAIQYIEEQYSQGVSLKEFCSEKNLNAPYIGYLFKKETGVFFNQYLTDYRTAKAIDLLCHSKAKINDISEMTGYATTSHFITTFKKKTGLSPLKYREVYGGIYHEEQPSPSIH